MLVDWLVEEVCSLQQKGEDLVLATVLKKSIGLEIKAETQVEIAFSIVSQLILARAQSAAI